MASQPTGGDADATTQITESALQTARCQLHQAAAHLDLDQNIVERLRHPATVHEVTVPIERDDGTVEAFTGYRAQPDRVRGPYKGGLRYHPRVTRDECVGLSMWMTWKCAVMEVHIARSTHPKYNYLNHH